MPRYHLCQMAFRGKLIHAKNRWHNFDNMGGYNLTQFKQKGRRTREVHLLFISSQSLNLGGHWGTPDDIATIPFHPSLSSAALRESPNPIPIHSLRLSPHLFFCLPLLLAPFTVPCRIVFAMPEDLEMWPYHFLLASFINHEIKNSTTSKITALLPNLTSLSPQQTTA